MRVLRSSAIKITSPTFVADDGETPEDCASTPTATVAHEDGSTLAALTVATTTDDGVYTATLPATHTANLGRLTVTWTGTADSLVQVYAQDLDVVGAHYVSLVELRGERGLDDTSKYPTATLARIRDQWATRVEEITGVSFCRRYRRETLTGDGTCRLRLNELMAREVLSVSIDGVAQTAANYTAWEDGTIIADIGLFTAGATVVVAYEHGFDSVPTDIRHELLKAIRQEVQRTLTDLPTDTISSAYDGQTIRYATPNPMLGRPTGILSFDAVLAQHHYRAPAVG